MHSGDSACALPPQTLAPTTWSTRSSSHTRALADVARGVRPDQRAVRGQGRAGLRARGQPAGEPDRALRGQGDRGARWPWWRPGSWSARRWPSCAPRACCRRRRRPGAGARPRQREGGGPALRPLPGRRHPARARDALDRRGDGRRQHLRPGVRQEPDGGRHPAARLGHGVPVAGRPGQAGRAGGGAGVRRARASPSRRPWARPATCAPRACRSTPWWPRWGRRAWPPTRSSSSRRARCSSW